jgi:hypothetical protein
MWTLFWDMNSGGKQKEKQSKIYIQAPQEEAKVIFYNRFGHNPERVTCTCCGEDYSINEHATLTQASAYHRHCAWDKKLERYVEKQNTDYVGVGKFIPLSQYRKDKDCLIIASKDIKPKERLGEVPQQGYVWQD